MSPSYISKLITENIKINNGLIYENLQADDLYDELGIQPGANKGQIKSAYIKLIKKWHPDKNFNSPEVKEKFFKISNAYKTLTNPKLLSQYVYNINNINIDTKLFADASLMLVRNAITKNISNKIIINTEITKYLKSIGYKKQLKSAVFIVSNQDCLFGFYPDGKLEGNIIIRNPPAIFDKNDLIKLRSLLIHELKHAVDYANGIDISRKTTTISHVDYTASTDYAEDIAEIRAYTDQMAYLIGIVGVTETKKLINGMFVESDALMKMLYGVIDDLSRNTLIHEETIDMIEHAKIELQRYFNDIVKKFSANRFFHKSKQQQTA